MRGKANALDPVTISGRITPAYAGKRGSSYLQSQFWWDHPRLCGEKAMVNGIMQTNWGSPPPMRGKDFTAFQHLMQLGITPAYAGKSLFL